MPNMLLGVGGSAVWSPAKHLETQSPSLWLRADQGVYTGGARQFYAADKGYLSIADNAALSTGDIDYTIAMWVYVDSLATTQTLVEKGDSSGVEYELRINPTTGVVDFSAYDGATTPVGSINSSGLSASTWYLIIASHNATSNQVELSINNTEVTPVATTGAAGESTGIFSLGVNSFAVAQFFGGRESKFGFWKRTLTTAEKTYLYNLGNGRVAGELGVAGTDGSALADVAGGSLPSYWNLNEGSGTANAIDAIGTNDLTPTFAELATNGAFATDTGWTKGTGWTIAAGVGTSDGTQVANSDLEQAYSVGTGRRYATSFDVTGYTAGNITAVVGATEGTDRAANGTFTQTVTVSATDSKLMLRADLDFVGNVDNYSVKAVDIPAADGPGEEIAADSVGTNHGQLINFADPDTAWSSDRPTPIAALVDGSLAFDGTNDSVNFTAITTGTTYTWGAWIKPNTPTEIFGSLFTTAPSGAGAYLTNARKVSLYYGSSHLNNTALTDAAWNHVVISVSAGNVTFYLNGVADGTASSATTFDAARMGYDAAPQGFKGSLSDVRFYAATALSAAQVAELYAGGEATGATPVSRWKLDDGPQTGLVDGDPVVRWSSIEGGYHDFEQATASKRPLYRSSAINGKPGIDFDGVDDLLVKASAFLTGTAGTVIVVYRLDGVTQRYQMMLGSSDVESAAAYLWFYGQGPEGHEHIYYNQIDFGVEDFLDGDTTVNVDTNYVAVFASNGSTITARLNGVAQTLTAHSGGNNGDWWDDVIPKDNVTIGAYKILIGEGQFLSGKICEVIVWPINLSSASIAKVSKYIVTRYGVSA